MSQNGPLDIDEILDIQAPGWRSINQRYVVRIEVREVHAIEVDAGSAQEAETLAWGEFNASEFREVPRRAEVIRVALKGNDAEAGP